MTEEWRTISGLEGFYEISNTGLCRNAKTKRLRKLVVTYRGYVQAHLYIKGKRVIRGVHRLVAEAFIGPVYDQVDHIDGDKQNNNVSNLRLCTKRENQLFHTKSKNPGSLKVSDNLYKAYISIDNKTIYLGKYATAEEASARYIEEKEALDRHIKNKAQS